MPTRFCGEDRMLGCHHRKELNCTWRFRLCSRNEIPSSDLRALPQALRAARRIDFRRMSVGKIRAVTPVDASQTAPVDVSQESLVLEPIREAGRDVLIVFAPGALTDAKEYLPLANEFQSSSGLRLWVVILSFPGNIPSTNVTEGSFDGVLQRVNSLGFKPGELAMDNVFLAGHSLGAWTARTVALHRTEGFIQMGSCFHTNPDNLLQYPKPVLTLNGELDGQLTLSATAKHAGEIFDAEPEMGCFNTYAYKPVILIPGMNHAQFSHGIPNTARGDFPAEISIEEARRAVAEVLAAFLEVQVEGSSSALEVLKAAVKQTHSMCKSYWEAIGKQGQDVNKFQLQLAGLPLELVTEKNITAVEHEYKDNFIYSKPSIDLNHPRIFNHKYLNPYGKYNIVKSLWIKMKSSEAVWAAFEQVPSDNSQRFAAEFNEQTFSEALEQVPEKSRTKYLQRGKKVKFLDDVGVVASSVEWIERDVAINVTSDAVEVQSPVLLAPMQGMASRYVGMHYMKLLTLAGAMQLILEDCFR